MVLAFMGLYSSGMWFAFLYTWEDNSRFFEFGGGRWEVGGVI